MKPPAAAVPPALPARRRFLQAGVAGTVLLAALPRLNAGARGPGEEAVSTQHRIALQAIVPVLLAGALPADAGRAAAVTAVVDGIEQAVRGLPLHLQAEVGQLFSLLSFA